MPAFLDVHKITEGTLQLYFRANPATYDSIGTNTGVEQPSTPGEFKNRRVYQISEILKGEDFVRLYIYYKVGGKRKVAKILAAKSKVASLLSGTLSYKGDTKATVRRKLERTFY